MIEVRGAGGSQLARRVELAHQMRERDRVGPARQRDHDARVAPGETVRPDRPADGVNQLLDGGKVGAGGRTRTADPALMRRVLLTN